MFYCHLLPIVDRIFFHCFGMSYFACIVLPFVDIFLTFLFFSSTFWYISSSCIVSFSWVVFSFLFLFISAFFFCFITFSCFRRFSIWVSSRNSHLGFDFSFVFFVFLRGSQFSRKLISLQHKLVHLIRLCYSLIYLSVLDSLYLSLP